jgi:hypothetical protein
MSKLLLENKIGHFFDLSYILEKSKSNDKIKTITNDYVIVDLKKTKYLFFVFKLEISNIHKRKYEGQFGIKEISRKTIKNFLINTNIVLNKKKLEITLHPNIIKYKKINETNYSFIFLRIHYEDDKTKFINKFKNINFKKLESEINHYINSKNKQITRYI